MLYRTTAPHLVIVGGGPAGLSPLLAAHRAGRLEELLAAGVVVVERSARLGAGDIGNYAINSDSTAATFVDCLHAGRDTPLAALRSHPLVARFAAAGDAAVPLAAVGQLMALIGEALGRMIAVAPRSAVLLRHRALSVQRHPGGWQTLVVDPHGRRREIGSRTVVSATGAAQPQRRLAAERVGGLDLHATHGAKLLQSGQVLTPRGLARVAHALAGRPDPKVAVVGGSTSAVAVTDALLNRLPAIRFGTGAVTLLHRRDLRIYYPSVAAARADGYAAFGDDDICPVSGRVFRLAGFRLDSRTLMQRVLGVGGLPPEPRVRLHRLAPVDPAAAAILDRADLVVAALGYRPNAIPVHDPAGNPVRLHAHANPHAPLVDGNCRVLAADGTPLPGLFAIGLAAGFRPSGKLGGEPSFRGQANGLWLWQTDVGRLIVDAVLADAPRQPVPRLHPVPAPVGALPVPLANPFAGPASKPAAPEARP